MTAHNTASVESIVDHRHCVATPSGECGRAIAPDARACDEHLAAALADDLVAERLNEAYGDGPER